MITENVPQARHEHSAPVSSGTLERHMLMDHHAAVPERERTAYHEAAHGGWADGVSYGPVNRGWKFCRSCGGAGWVGSRVDHRHPDCGHHCILCYPPPGYDRTYAVDGFDGEPT